MRREKKQAQKAEFKKIKDDLDSSSSDEEGNGIVNDFLKNGVMPMDCEPQETVVLPVVKYDNCEDNHEGPDSFAKHHAPIFHLKEQIKALKPSIKEAKKSGNTEAFKELHTQRHQLRKQMKLAQAKAIVSTLSEKHSEKNLDEVLDLHGLRGQEARAVVTQQLPLIENRVASG